MNVKGIYNGNMLENKRHGEGIFTWIKGEENDSDYEKILYSGTWKNDLLHGEGIYKKNNNYECKGSWKKGEMHGFGQEEIGRTSSDN